MTAGVPGLGLGGLFALIAAFGLPLLSRTSRRSGSRLVGMAIIIVLAAIAAWRSATWLYSVATESHAHDLARSGGSVLAHPVVGQLFGVPVIVVSVLLLTLLLMLGEILFLVLGVRPTPLPPPIPAPESGARAGTPTLRGPTAGDLVDHDEIRALRDQPEA